MIVFHLPENIKRLNDDSILVSNSNKHAQQQFTVASPSDRQLEDNILSTKGIDFFEGEIHTVGTIELKTSFLVQWLEPIPTA